MGKVHWYMHVNLCRITKLDLGPEIDVLELRDEHVQQRARERIPEKGYPRKGTRERIPEKGYPMGHMHGSLLRNVKMTSNNIPNFVVKEIKF